MINIVVVLIALIIVFVAIGMFALDPTEDFEDTRKVAFGVAMLTNILLIIASGALAIATSNQPVVRTQENVRGSFAIKTFTTSNNLSGFFFLGTGRIENESVYVFYTVAENGGLIRGTIPTEGAYIFESNFVEPHIEDIIVEERKTLGMFYTSNRFGEYHIYVPVGTVIVNFEVNG